MSDFRKLIQRPYVERVVFAIALAALVFVSPASAQSSVSYRVVGIAPNDVLNLRAGAGSGFPIVGAIPPNGSGVRIVGACVRSWCEVAYADIHGWANSRFLAPEGGGSVLIPAQPAQAGYWFYRVVGVAGNDALNMRSGASSDYPIVAIIPPNGREIVAVDREGSWWKITYNDAVGWVNNRYLARDRYCGGCGGR